MVKDKNGVSLFDNEKIDETYGHTIENILRTTMNFEEITTYLQYFLDDGHNFPSLIWFYMEG